MEKKSTLNYLGSCGILILTAYFSHFSSGIFSFFNHSSDHNLLTIFFIIGIIFILSFAIFYVAHLTTIPSFVVAIFFGMAAHPLLNSIIEHHEILSALVGFSATLILFGGGLETHFHNFKKLFWKICSLSFPGLVFTAFTFSAFVLIVNHFFNTTISLTAAVLLGAVLASTDPAAIIPILKRLRFHNHLTKDIIVSESAVTDVTGTLLTVAFLGTLLTTTSLPHSLPGWYLTILTPTSGILLLKQIVYGILFGILGYALLEVLNKTKRRFGQEFEADAAFFLCIPILIFTMALSFGGSGYLAAFITGLLFNLTQHLHETEKFFNHTIEGFFKPVIFILLGALVNPAELIHFATIGIVLAFIFMIIIRPLAVLLTLAPLSLIGANRLGWRELVFISFVRETGAIPAVLLVTIASLKLTSMDGLLPIGMWVILLTLIIEPILTPTVAKFLRVAEPIADQTKADLSSNGNPMVILGTRGHTFLERLPKVVDWAKRHHVSSIMVLLCLEDKFTTKLESEIKKQAETAFTALRIEDPSLSLSFLSRTGFLQENINALARETTQVSAFFVGRKMLDYRLEEIKNLAVPIYFLK